MEPGTTSLATRARSIFDDLGYDVVGEGARFRAERDWKVVRVAATEDPTPDDVDGLTCVVTSSDAAARVRRRLRQRAGDEEWAIIAVDGDDHEVVRAPPGPDGPAH